MFSTDKCKFSQSTIIKKEHCTLSLSSQRVAVTVHNTAKDTLTFTYAYSSKLWNEQADLLTDFVVGT